MSRIGKQPVTLPAAVKVVVNGDCISVEGPKGKLESPSFPGVTITQEENTIVCTVDNNDKKLRAMHGLSRAYIANMVKGVTEGFSKKLEIIGVGYRMKAQGKVLDFTLGKSHQVLFEVPNELDVTVEDPTHFTVSGIDKQLVGQISADIRALYPPEPYKGKGIRYNGEHVRRKAGKTVG